VMLLINFQWIGDLSFQLSVMATLGIIIFGKDSDVAGRHDFSSTVTQGMGTISDKKVLLDQDAENSMPTSAMSRWLWSLIRDDLRITLAAQVFTIPIVLIQFQRISLVSPLSNILIGWLMAPIMVVGFSMVAMGLVWLPLAVPLAWILWVPLTFVLIVIEWTAKLPFASIAF
jgi:predicted membrane metal-binding protein